MAEEGSSAPDIFEVVRDSTRMDVLHALASAYHGSPEDPWLAYSDLREAVGINDKGNFNYHLDRLGELIVKGAEGYRISGLGMRIVLMVASGDLDPDWSWGPIDVPGACPYCGDPVSLRYENLGLELECERGEHPLALAVSPRLLDDHEGDVTERVAVVVGQRVELARRGICPDCQGHLDGRIEPGDWTEGYAFHGDCGTCGMHVGHTVGTLLHGHPEVVGFFAERGIDVRTRPFWRLDFCKAGHETVVSTDPLRVRIDVERQDSTLSLALDREAEVVSVDRPAEPG